MANFLAPHARDKIQEDVIFQVGSRAREAKMAHGAEKVVDGSIGFLLTDDGQLAVPEAVNAATSRLDPQEYARYAPIGGLPEYREDVLHYLFGHVPTQGAMGCVATAGATGGLFLCLWNLLSEGEYLITHDYFWSPYAAVARNALRTIDVFRTFRHDGSFHVEAAIQHTEKSLEKQDRALLLLNVPCQNPTGICLNPDQARNLKQGLVDLANKHPNRPLTLLVDGAYLEFEDAQRNRDFLALFHDLPPNMLFIFAHTISKGFARYGFRTGALAVVGTNRKAVDVVVDTLIASVRSTWSNTPRIGQMLFSEIHRDETLRKQLEIQQQDLAALCNARGRIFVEEADRIGLPITPYDRGFFITIPCENSRIITDRLAERHVFLVPLKRGVRVALCALPSHQVPGLATTIAKCL